MNKENDFIEGNRGPVITAPPGKTRITIRIDSDVLDWFRLQVEKAGGGSYQTSINAALREYMHSQKEPVEDVLRQVIREELSTFGEKCFMRAESE